ncbi:unnamed protein product [Ambrosiozyma monospora]|uniref:Unnamed protein product n=1 Tax=Ambrosiozyma monospora TaxID=43982 RepID=A0A9W7DPB0_AMBMO|nr:unnamed protein product [Ambrosiozyma monospora]
MANFWHTIHKALGTELLFTTTNHPAADGQSERMMRVLNQLLRSYCEEYYNKWDTLLAVVEFAYNTTYQKSIDDIPFRVDYGLIPRFPQWDLQSYVFVSRKLFPSPEWIGRISS